MILWAVFLVAATVTWGTELFWWIVFCFLAVKSVKQLIRGRGFFGIRLGNAVGVLTTLVLALTESEYLVPFVIGWGVYSLIRAIVFKRDGLMKRLLLDNRLMDGIDKLGADAMSAGDAFSNRSGEQAIQAAKERRKFQEALSERHARERQQRKRKPFWRLL